ncbi:MAG: hypothetical protein HY271_07475 [Deltaproteobacteria bacterium]|nr:hypothetical protein [Deltaproteobacteria bacterium]
MARLDPTMPGLHLAPDHVFVRVQRVAGAVGAGAILLCVAGALLNPAAFFRAYLVAYLFWFGIALGSLAILMVQYVTGGAWGAVVRRVLESGTRTLPLMAVLFVPLAFGLPYLYVWARPEVVAHDALLQHQRIYLNVPFFLVRAAFYFAVWITVTHFLNRWSLAQDSRPEPRLERRLEMLSRAGLMLYGLTETFAAIDWAMSLDPHWASTIYGILLMGGQGLAAFAFVIPVAAILARRPPLSRIITPDQFHDLGKLMLAFVMLWAYFSFSQFLIIWSGNLPEEIPWYLRRIQGGWLWVGILLALAHFMLPFVVLLSRDVKRRPRVLALVAGMLIVARFVDIFWLVRPTQGSAGLELHWLDFVTPFAIGGLWLWVFVWQLGTRPLVPVNDPCLPVMEAA